MIKFHYFIMSDSNSYKSPANELLLQTFFKA